MSVEKRERDIEVARKQLDFLKDLMEIGESVDLERIIMSLAQVGGIGNIMTEFPSDMGALAMSVMEAIIDPIGTEGRVDDVVQYDNPVVRAQCVYYKYNMISNKRKGRMENVKIMAPKEEEEGMVGKVKKQMSPDAI